MKDFDSEREIREDRSFRLGGKDYTFRPRVQQELVDSYFDSLRDTEQSNAETLRVMDALVIGGLEPQFAEQWREARGPDSEFPVMSEDIHGVIRYMLEVMLDRPIESPSASGSTDGPTGTSSTEKLPEPEVQT